MTETFCGNPRPKVEKNWRCLATQVPFMAQVSVDAFSKGHSAGEPQKVIGSRIPSGPLFFKAIFV